MKEIKYYDLNGSQDVVMLQCKYSIFKRIVNILSSMSTKKDIDFNLMKDAFNMIIDRNDSLRIRFAKKGKKLVQYFIDEYTFDDIPVYEFKTESEQVAFINKLKKKPIKYMKGQVVEPYFIKTFDGKNMVFLKVCHLILDIYGINIIFRDLFAVYEALAEGKDLPEPPNSFEEVLQKDLSRKHNQERLEKNTEFFKEYFAGTEEPYYAGIHGPEQQLWKKQLAKGKRAMKMFFVHNDTHGYEHHISKETMDKVVEACKKLECSPANFMLYACCLTASRINNNISNMLPMLLYNCRGSALEKNCAGTKAQSMCSYTKIDYNKTFNENLAEFLPQHTKLYRRIGFSDQQMVSILHKAYGGSFMETYYSIAFSFIPYTKPEDLEFEMYSNEKCALPAYLALFYDLNKGDILMYYDVQTIITTGQDVEKFHQNFVSVLNQITDNLDIPVSEIKVNN